MLDSEQLNVVTKRVEGRFGQIKTKYPELKAYLVFFLPLGQVNIEASPKQILSDFPEMVVDNKAKNDGLRLISEIKKAEKQERSSEVDRLNKQFDLFVPQIRYDENVRVEIRFKDLKFKLVWALQADELVDRDLTLQTKASIRIVLGTVGQFCK